MGSHPDATTPSPKAITAEGHLEPQLWARLVVARLNKADTGILKVRHNGDERVFYFVKGVPVCAKSTIGAEDFTETMVLAKTLDPARLKWIRKHTGAEESEIEALIGAGSIQRADVDAHHPHHVQHLIAATLAWPEGEFFWTPTPQCHDRFEQSALPKVDVIEGLIEGILGGFDIQSLHTFVDAADAGHFLPQASTAGVALPAWVPAEVYQELGRGQSREDIAATIAMDPDRLAAVLWLLEATNISQRAHPPSALMPLGKVATLQPGTVVTKPTQPPQTKTVTPKVKAVASTKPTSHAIAADPPPAPTPVQPKPKLELKAKASPEAILATALLAIADEDFDTAYAQLSSMRKHRPSCPDTLAALGWTAWRTQNLGTNAYDGPEDFLLLALTFDAAHPKALEYFARLALDKGEKENARNRLLQVLAVTPRAEWAKTALTELSPKGAKTNFRLWPKGHS